MRIAITGANGFIGSQLTKDLVQAGYTVTTITRQPFGCSAQHALVTGPAGISTLTEHDLADIDCIIHLAAQAHNPKASTADYVLNNVEQTRHLLHIAGLAQVRRLIYTSSIKAVGEDSGKTPFNRSTVPAPEDDYGRSKLATEQLIHTTCSSTGIKYLILRLPLIFDGTAKGNLQLLNKALSRNIPLPLYITDNRRDTLTLQNLSSAITRCLKNWPETADTLYLSDGNTHSTAEIIQRLAQVNGQSARLFRCPKPLLKLALNCLGKAEWYRRLTGNLEVDLADTLNTLQWQPEQWHAASSPEGKTKTK